MLGGNKNIKDIKQDSTNDLDVIIKDISISYTKTNKLITALYMVTDIIDKDEPLRNKLRILGTGIISDMHSTPSNACNKINQIMSFLDIASAISIISEMNTNILRKEFLELNQSIKESTDKVEPLNRQIDLSAFFKAELPSTKRSLGKVQYSSIGHQYPTRIGVQKGSTLMKALSDRTQNLSDRATKNADDFLILKKERRYEIINSIKANGDSATITDIKNKAQGLLTSCSEKTLQRELMSMIKDGVLNKTGEKRWSRYFIKS